MNRKRTQPSWSRSNSQRRPVPGARPNQRSTNSVPDNVSLASEMVASIDARETDVVVISALPPKAALHARYLLKLIQARGGEQRVIAELWTNDKESALKLNLQIATTLDAVRDQLDQITPMILLTKAPAAGPIPEASLGNGDGSDALGAPAYA